MPRMPKYLKREWAFFLDERGRNEKFCGDALCQKTVTIDFFTHKSVKNNGIEPQYFVEGHHIPIIEKTDWLLAQQIRKERRYRKGGWSARREREAAAALAESSIDNEEVNN